MSLFLDTGVLGMVTHPRAATLNAACLNWLEGCIGAGSTICVPEIADYELHRELIRLDSKSLQRLDELESVVGECVPLSTPAMREAADLWAQMRKQGTPTPPTSLWTAM